MGMVKMVDDRQVENGNFKASGYKDLERWLHTQIPGCKLKADPHIKSRHRYFKEKFCAQLELKNYASGFGWDEIRQCVTMDDNTWAGYVKTHPKAKGLNNTPLPFWDELCKIFGQSRACGDEACQADDAASMLQRKLDVNAEMEQDSTPFVGDESVGIDSRHRLEDMVNAGYDIHATGLQDTEDNEVN